MERKGMCMGGGGGGGGSTEQKYKGEEREEEKLIIRPGHLITYVTRFSQGQQKTAKSKEIK